MWFFTLALLIVAGYLLYDAMRDRMAMQTPHELGAANRSKTDAQSNKPHVYVNTGDPQIDGSGLNDGSDEPNAAVSTLQSTATSLIPSMSGLSIGSSRARNSIHELWRDAKSKTQIDDTENMPRQTSDRTAGAIQDVKAGIDKFKLTVADSLREAKTKQNNAREAAGEQEELTTIKDTLVIGTRRFKDSLAEPWAQRNSVQSKVAMKKSQFSDTGHDTAANSSIQSQSAENESVVLPDNVTAIKPGDTDAERADQYTWPSSSSDGAARSRQFKAEGNTPHSATKKSPVSTGSDTATVKEKRKFLAQPQGKKDNLTKVKGIGPVIEKHLNEMGVYHFHQLATINQADIDYINEALDFPGRIERDNWIEQARALSGTRPTEKT